MCERTNLRVKVLCGGRIILKLLNDKHKEKNKNKILKLKFTNLNLNL